MPVPTSMSDLSTTEGANGPVGSSESPSVLDNYQRALGAILRHTNFKGVDIASAATTNIGSATGEFVDITGTTTITSFGTISAGIERTVRFTSALTVTHNATSLILPNGLNITTYSGYCAVFRSLGSGNWILIADNKSIASTLQNQTFTAFTTGGTSSAYTGTPASAITTRTENQLFFVELHTDPTGSPTLAISGLATRNCRYIDAANTKQFITPTQVKAGNKYFVCDDGADYVFLNILPQSSSGDIKSFTAVANTPASAVTITINPQTIDFRATTLTSGVPVTRSISSAITLVISNGSTLGAGNNFASRIAVLAIDNAGTVEVAVVNLAGGVNLDETGLISTTAEGGAGAADSAAVIYSTTARSNVAYRVIGYYDETQTVAGTHSAVLTKVAAVKSESGLYLTYKSTAQTITSAGLLTLAHGLGYIPTNFRFRLRNTTTEAGWAVNDEVQVGFGDYQNGRHAQVYADIQNVYVRYGNSAGVFVVGHKTTGVSTVLTNSSWALLIEAGR